MRNLFWALPMAITACASVDYTEMERGTFKGAAVVVWTGAGETSIVGDGEFLYVPVAGQELVFVRSDDANASGGSQIIEPEAFYTDGGSVPRAVQALRGFNAWGYGPAYVIHDWLFVAKKCLNDGDPANITDEMRKIEDMTFQESARVMGETIRTLVDQYDIGGGDTFSGSVITSVTAGPITHRLWTEKGKCEANKVTNPDHLKIIADLQNRNTARSRSNTFDTLRTAPEPTPGVPAYVIVGTYNFN